MDEKNNRENTLLLMTSNILAGVYASGKYDLVDETSLSYPEVVCERAEMALDQAMAIVGAYSKFFNKENKT